MSVKYQIISNLRLVYVDMPKALSLEELVSHLEELAADENYVPPMKKIVDFSHVKDTAMPAFDIAGFSKLKAFYENELRGEHCVFVAPSNFMFGMGRIFEGYMGAAPIEVSVVRSLEAALSLLNIGEEEFRAGQGTECSKNNYNRA